MLKYKNVKGGVLSLLENGDKNDLNNIFINDEKSLNFNFVFGFVFVINWIGFVMVVVGKGLGVCCCVWIFIVWWIWIFWGIIIRIFGWVFLLKIFVN